MHIDIIELSVLVGAVMTILGGGVFIKNIINKALKPLREMEKKQDMQGKAICSVLRNSITRTHREFMAAGKIGRYYCSLQSKCTTSTRHSAATVLLMR